MTKPVLYSFRRCPYAIRARLAIKYSDIRVELREVVLRDKPPALLRASAKATVPVLITGDKQIIDESLDIMLWALRQHDPAGWLEREASAHSAMLNLISACDGPFKQALDRYKYADRQAQHPAAWHRAQAEFFLQMLEQRLDRSRYLFGTRPGCADMAVLPFVRQFALVDRDWFDSSAYTATRHWLDQLLATPLFAAVMQKYPPWQEGIKGVLF
jgi:glutathione S-transferase